MWNRIPAARLWWTGQSITAGPAQRPIWVRAHWGEGMDRSRLLDLEFWSKAGGAQTWREMHAAPQSSDQPQLLRRCTYSGRPYGEEDFVTRLEDQFQRSWRRWGFQKLASSA